MTPRSPTHAGRTHSVNLDNVTFGASIDFVTLATPCRMPLPSLQGHAIWPTSQNGERITVQEPTVDDVTALSAVFGILPIFELEVCIDLRPRPSIVGAARQSLLENILVDLFACELEPSRGKGMRNQFRAAHRAHDFGYDTLPFNLRLPLATDQQLYGGRHDDSQVKSYMKRTDKRKALPLEEWVARVEVRLQGDSLRARGLNVLSDLQGFRYRKELMPYFTHVNGSRRLKANTKLPQKFQLPIDERRNLEDKRFFEKYGVGCLLDDHKVPSRSIRLVRDIPVNNRIGGALGRLERQFEVDPFSRTPYCSHQWSPRCPSQSRRTRRSFVNKSSNWRAPAGRLRSCRVSSARARRASPTGSGRVRETVASR